jgi:type VI secretion system protein VasD
MRSIAMPFLLASATLLLSACGAWQSVSDSSSRIFHKQVKVVNVDITSRVSLNPDEAKRAYPVVVRVYQLKDRKSFDTASYGDLLDKDRAILGADLEDIRGVVLYPESSASVSQRLNPATQYVAVVAYFRDAKVDGDWRRVMARKALSPDESLKFELVDNALVAPTDAAVERPGS